MALLFADSHTTRFAQKQDLWRITAPTSISPIQNHKITVNKVAAAQIRFSAPNANVDIHIQEL